MDRGNEEDKMPWWFRPVSIIVPCVLCALCIFVVEANNEAVEASGFGSSFGSAFQSFEKDDVSDKLEDELAEQLGITGDDESDTSDGTTGNDNTSNDNTGNDNTGNDNTGDDTAEQEQASTPALSPDEVEAIETNFYYKQLSTPQQTVYLVLYDAVAAGKKELSFTSKMPKISSDDMQAVSYALFLDNPGMFWFYPAGVSWSQEAPDGTRYVVRYECKEAFDRNQINTYQKQIDAVADKMVAETAQMQTEVEKALYIYEYIITHCEYDHATAARSDISEKTTQDYLSRTMTGVFVNQMAVCAGYSKAYVYLLEQCGIEATTVIGDIKESGELHEWSLACLDGQYCYIDSTWGDPNLEEPDPDAISYQYFGLSADQLAVTHHLDENYTYPPCDSIAYNHAVMNGYYFETYDAAALSALVAQGVADGSYSATFAFATPELYQQAITNLFDKDDVWEIIGDTPVSAYQYVPYQEHNAIELTYLK